MGSLLCIEERKDCDLPRGDRKVGDSGTSVMDARLMRAAVGLTGLEFWALEGCGVDPSRPMFESWDPGIRSLGGIPSAALSQSPLSLLLSIYNHKVFSALVCHANDGTHLKKAALSRSPFSFIMSICRSIAAYVENANHQLHLRNPGSHSALSCSSAIASAYVNRANDESHLKKAPLSPCPFNIIVSICRSVAPSAYANNANQQLHLLKSPLTLSTEPCLVHRRSQCTLSICNNANNLSQMRGAALVHSHSAVSCPSEQVSIAASSSFIVCSLDHSETLLKV